MNALRKAFDNVMKMNHDIIEKCLEATKVESFSFKINQDKVLVNPTDK